MIIGTAMHARRYAKTAFALATLALIAGCEGKGPVEAKELARTVSRLERGGSAGAAAEERLSQSSPYITWKMLVPLIEKKGGSSEARAAAIRAIAKSQGDLGLPGAVVRAASDPDARVRSEAIRALVERGDPDFGRGLRDAVRQAADPAVKKDLEDALAQLKGRERHWYKQRMTTSPLAEERALAARALSEIGTEEDVPALIEAYARPDVTQLFQQEVLLALSKIGGDASKEFVRGELMSKDPFMRGISAFAETRLQDPLAIPQLEALLAQEMVGDTRVSAATALGLIGTEEAKAALAKSCKLGTKDSRVDLACRDAQKQVAKRP